MENEEFINNKLQINSILINQALAILFLTHEKILLENFYLNRSKTFYKNQDKIKEIFKEEFLNFNNLFDSKAKEEFIKFFDTFK